MSVEQLEVCSPPSPPLCQIRRCNALLVAATGLGSLLGALSIAAMGDFPRKGRLFLATTALFGLTLSAFALTDRMLVGIGMILLAGLASAGFGVLQSTLMLLLSPEDARGRTMGVLMLSIGALPLALLVQGAAAAAIGVVATTVISGVLLAVAIMLLAMLNSAPLALGLTCPDRFAGCTLS